MTNLETAVEFCSRLERLIRTAGCHCALTGSTLYGMGTNHDIDVTIYGHYYQDSRIPVDPPFIFNAVRQIAEKVRYKNNSDYNDCIVASFGGRNVDIFIIGNETPTK